MNQGNEEYSKDDFRNATDFYTEGINVNCKDQELNSKLYSNRASVQFLRGEYFFIHLLTFLFCYFYTYVILTRWQGYCFRLDAFCGYFRSENASLIFTCGFPEFARACHGQ